MTLGRVAKVARMHPREIAGRAAEAARTAIERTSTLLQTPRWERKSL